MEDALIFVSFLLACAAPVLLAVFILKKYAKVTPARRIEIGKQLLNGVRTFIVALIAVVGVPWYLSPHPRPRTMVRLHNDEDIITIDGVSESGWLRECNTGNRRHVVGDFTTIEKSTPPVLCVGDRGYEEWLKNTTGTASR